jgi:hypothetical protein
MEVVSEMCVLFRHYPDGGRRWALEIDLRVLSPRTLLGSRGLTTREGQVRALEDFLFTKL